MNKKVWSIEINKESNICTLNTGVDLEIGYKGNTRISYTKQEIEVYKLIARNYVEYRMIMLKGCIWGPGTLTQMSNMTLRFVMK